MSSPPVQSSQHDYFLPPRFVGFSSLLSNKLRWLGSRFSERVNRIRLSRRPDTGVVMNFHRYLLIGLLAAVFAALIIPEPVLATHWTSGGATLRPNEPYQGVLTTFYLRVVNGASDYELIVTLVWVHFCWQQTTPTEDGYFFYDNDFPPTPYIPPGGYRDYPGAIQVPEDRSGSCSIHAKVTGRTTYENFYTTDFYGSINILVPAPLAVSISPNPNVGVAPLAVKFYTTVTGGVYPYTYSWTFGDGEISAQKDPLHTYTSSGTWTVTLVVVDSQSRQQSKTTTVTVSPSSSPSPTPTPSPGPTPPPPAPPFWQQYWYLILAAVGVAVAVPIVMRTVKASSAKTHPQPPAGQIPSPARQFCANCGAALSSSESFCSACGKASS